jgi:tRNA (adenine57-N1/adenine58-N1)-methyltransferase
MLIDETKLNEDLNTNLGIIKKQDLITAPAGAKLKTHTNNELTVLEPSFYDLFEMIQRGPQIITLKDAGIISAYTGVSPGMRIVDAGLGSGALTCYLANLVKPTGKVYAYELRDEFIKTAQSNIELFKLKNYVEVKNKSVYDGIDERDIDLVTLDLPEPWKAVGAVNKSLKTGGYLVSYVPTITQVSALSESLAKENLKQLKVIQVTENPWIVDNRVIRPENVTLTFTGFLLFARKM